MSPSNSHEPTDAPELLEELLEALERLEALEDMLDALLLRCWLVASDLVCIELLGGLRYIR